MYKQQPSKTTSPVYLPYLMRLWCAPSSREWLASLEAPGTHERHNFSDLASLFAFLQAQTCPEDAEQVSSKQRETKDYLNLHQEPP